MPRIESDAARIVGLRIQHARQQALITQRALEQLSGIDVSNIGKYERGLALPNLGSLIRIAHALDIDPGALVHDLTPDHLPGKPETYTVHDFVAERRKRLARREEESTEGE